MQPNVSQPHDDWPDDESNDVRPHVPVTDEPLANDVRPDVCWPNDESNNVRPHIPEPHVLESDIVQPHYWEPDICKSDVAEPDVLLADVGQPHRVPVVGPPDDRKPDDERSHVSESNHVWAHDVRTD